jgi:hypothetical protein
LFPENVGAVTDEPAERFYQDRANFEQQYQGQWDPAMMGITARYSIRKIKLLIQEESNCKIMEFNTF